MNTDNQADIYACLDRLLASATFAHAQRMKQLLRYLVSETLAGRAGQLKGYTIAIEVFGRSEEFDPALDAIVRVQAGHLRAKLREYYDGEGSSDSFRFELPKGGYAIRIEATQRRSPFAEQDVPSTAGRSALKMPTLGPIVEGAGTGEFPRPAPIEDKPSLAVLPFVNWSSDPEQDYFADGITEDLTTELSRLSGLFVISRHSAFVYKGVAKSAAEISAELGVRYLLEGSVRKAGTRVRISAQLADAASGAHVWAERYDREIEDIFAVQDEVTQRIISVLQVKLPLGEAPWPRSAEVGNIEAYDALLRGLERFWLFTRESTEDARIHFTRAIELEPSYAAGHAWLARALVFRWIMTWDPTCQTLERAYEHARLSVDLDSGLPLAHSVLGWVQLWRRQADSSIAAGLRAVSLDPNNADAYLFLSYALVAVGRADESLRYIEKGIRLNPHPSAVYQTALGLSYFALEEYDKAIAAFRRGIEVTDVFIPNHYYLCIIYTLLDRDAEARNERDKLLTLSGHRPPVTQTTFWVDEALSRRQHDLARRAGLA